MDWLGDSGWKCCDLRLCRGHNPPVERRARGRTGAVHSVDYKVVSLNGAFAVIEATIRGPAAKLAVILTDPQGRSDQRIVGKDEMISNSHTVQLSMDDPKVGKYVLAVKTIDPENIVWQKELVFSLTQLSVKDVTFGFEPNNWMGQFHGYQLRSIQIALRRPAICRLRLRTPRSHWMAAHLAATSRRV